MNFLELYWVDTYKVGHKRMLPTGSVLMSSNLTARSGKNSNCPNNGKIVNFGQQKTFRQLVEDWNKNFFARPVSEIHQFAKDMGDLLGTEPIDVQHFLDLHDLGYLPIEVRALPEGELLPYKIPLFTIVNTKPLCDRVFDWIVNYLETIMSAESWNAVTSATMSYTYRQLGKEWISKTDPENIQFLDYIFHNFSMRGMDGKSSIINSGLGFATCSRGSDTLPVIPAARKYYDEKEVCINSVYASEHAIMCTLTGFFLKTKDGNWDKVGELEIETFRYLLKTFPNGILSLVSDTWDLWRVIADYCVVLKDEILARDGKLVIRPDSGNPVHIVCGREYKVVNSLTDLYFIDSPEVVYAVDEGKYYETNPYDDGHKTRFNFKDLSYEEVVGVIELLHDIFGGDMTSTGYARLNPKIGCIYGDSINYTRAEKIFQRLEAKGFAATNIVLGVGSYSLQYVTRDTHGIAQKATYVEIEIEGHIYGIELFKDPITDDGIKKSAKGLIAVYKDESGEYYIKDQATWEEVYNCELQTILKDGVFYNQTTLSAIRKKLMTYNGHTEPSIS